MKWYNGIDALAKNTAQDIRELENEIAKQEYINKYLESYNKL